MNLRCGAGWVATGSCLIGILLLTACRIVQKTADLPGDAVRVVLPGKPRDQGVDLVDLQQTLMRFADSFGLQVGLAAEQFRQGTNPISPAEVLRWKTGYVGELTGIASGQNALANLLDMITVTTLTRMAAEHYWIPRAYGESAQPLLSVSRQAEVQIWKIAETILDEPQRQELREGIEQYYATEPSPYSIPGIRAVNILSGTQKRSTEARAEPNSVFGLLRLDPLAGLNPATQELAATRLLGDRAVYLAQRFPMLLRWQTELATMNVLQIGEVKRIVETSSTVAESMDRISRVAEGLPDRVAEERKAILKTAEEQEPELKALASEIRLMLAEGSKTWRDLTITLETFNKTVAALTPDPGKPPSTNSEPFRIGDYESAAAQIDRTALQLTELLRTFDGTLGSTNLTRLSAEVDRLVNRAETGGKGVVDLAFWRSLALIACGCGFFLATAVLYRKWIKGIR